MTPSDPNERLTLVGPGLALIIVHMEHDIIDADAPFGSVFAAEIERRNVVDNCRRAAVAVRENGGLVVFARIAFKDDGSDLNANIPLLAMARDANCLIDGTRGTEIIEELPVGADDVILTHTRPGPFTGTELEKILHDNAIRDVAVAGVATNASVEATIRQAADLGFSPFLLEDACSAADAAQHDASVGTIGGLFGSVITVDEMSAALP
ncbi:hypothetical protein BSZ39_06140 [Bowdeniella nasicola]|uniref:Isochorismatase-like domain-containing protein n=1 Tax=Bowdeniella nasicola TaxID=208480 RepID=A0A1Q5Q2L3_9ACTO|nr:cysteine hydrolase [Bowdeniella nasicola]OKL54036.1 hypothetical protein BSZ39_06140 [Bowdeniella nasicola]